MCDDANIPRTYGRGAGERIYRGIPMPSFRPKISRLYESGHVAYPQTGVYACENPCQDDGQAGDKACR